MRRFAFFSPIEAIHAAFGIDSCVAPKPSYNVAPTQNVWVIRADVSGQLIPDVLRWGLVPFWAKDPGIGARMINAPAETVHATPSFRHAFARQRCVILASGFYEWHADGSGKWPWFTRVRDADVFGMAGLWDQWHGADDERLRTCTVITKPANERMARLHHRMPVVMGLDETNQWLNAAATAEACEAQLLGQQSVELMAWKVGEEVNNPANNSPRLLAHAAGRD